MFWNQNNDQKIDDEFFGRALQELFVKLKRYDSNAKVKLPKWLKWRVSDYFNEGEIVGLDYKEEEKILYPKSIYKLSDERKN